MSDSMKDFIKKILDKDPSKRLGNKGPEEIMQHPWFDDLDFNKLIKKQIKAPYVPEVQTEEQIRRDIKNKPEPNFKKRETKLDPATQNLIKRYDDKFAKF